MAVQIMMVSSPMPQIIELFEPDGHSQQMEISVDWDGYNRELFLYEIPRGMEIIGLECVRFDRPPDS